MDHHKEYELISALNDSEESWQDWYAHYQQLTPKDQAAVRYMLTAAGKIGDAEEYLNLSGPIVCIAQKEVNNGFGMMFAADRECFASQNAKLFYVRSDMWIVPEKTSPDVPEWINRMVDGCKKFSSGLKDIQSEVIEYAFQNEPPCQYYAITFRFDAKEIRKSIRMGDERWYPIHENPYVFTLADITGEYEYSIGELTNVGPVVLYHEEIDFC